MRPGQEQDEHTTDQDDPSEQRDDHRQCAARPDVMAEHLELPPFNRTQGYCD